MNVDIHDCSGIPQLGVSAADKAIYARWHDILGKAVVRRAQ